MNKVFLIGRIAADPELRTTQSGISVASYRLAVNRRKSADGKQEADFVPCIAWNKGAEFVAKYFNKGMKIAVVGHLQTRSYDAQDGSKRYVTEVIVDEQEFCESKQQTAQSVGYESQSAPTEPAQGNYNSGGFTQVDDDELPF